MSESLKEIIAREVSSYFRYDSPRPYQIEESGANIYMRWSTDDVGDIFIARTRTVGGLTTNDFSFTKWSLRASATYTYNI